MNEAQTELAGTKLVAKKHQALFEIPVKIWFY